jgi:hypothetical protein
MPPQELKAKILLLPKHKIYLYAEYHIAFYKHKNFINIKISIYLLNNIIYIILD